MLTLRDIVILSFPKGTLQEWELFTGLIVDDAAAYSMKGTEWIGNERKQAVAKLQVFPFFRYKKPFFLKKSEFLQIRSNDGG